MAEIQLTEGAIASMMSGDPAQNDLKPVLQVVDIRRLNTQTQNTERYLILLSDGEFMEQGILATPRNELVKTEKLQKGSVVQLTDFICTVIQNRRIIIIIDLKVILAKCDLIGLPKPYPVNADENVPSVAKSPAPGHYLRSTA